MNNSLAVNEATINDFLNGDIQALMTIYEITKDLIYTVIIRIVANQHDAEDLLHDVYIKVFEKRQTYQKEKAQISTWLYRIAVNEALNFQKKARRTSNDLPEMLARGCDALENIIYKERNTVLQSALQQVPDMNRTCLILSEMEGLSYEEISIILNIPQGTVGSRINRAKQLLKQIIIQGGILCASR